MTAEEINACLAANLRAERARSAVGQAEVSRAMAAVGFDWHRQTVSQSETGRRRLLAAEVPALAAVLGTTTARLMDAEPGLLDSARRLELRPGDRIVVTVPGVITAAGGDEIKTRVRAILGWDGPLLVLGAGIGLTVLSTSAAAAAPAAEQQPGDHAAAAPPPVTPHPHDPPEGAP